MRGLFRLYLHSIWVHYILYLRRWGTLLGFVGLIVALPLTTLIIAYWQRYVTKEKVLAEKDNENAASDKKQPK